jgi:hypothetical protein
MIELGGKVSLKRIKEILLSGVNYGREGYGVPDPGAAVLLARREISYRDQDELAHEALALVKSYEAVYNAAQQQLVDVLK